MASAAPAIHRPIRERVSEEEWQTRVDLAACYRLLAHFGMTDLIYNHATARVPAERGHILINAFGPAYEEVTASNLQKIDLDGNSILRGEGDYGLNPAGYVIHSAVHLGRDDAGCVIHTHSRATAAIAATQMELLPISQSAMFLFERVSYHEFQSLGIRTDERAHVITDLGRNDVMLMRNHGTLTLGRTVAHAFWLAYQVEAACRIQVDALAGAPLSLVPRQVCEGVRDRGERALAAGGARLEWAAMLRMLDRQDSSYRA